MTRRRAFLMWLALSAIGSACEGTSFRCDPSPSWSSRDDLRDGGALYGCRDGTCGVGEIALGPRHSCVATPGDRELVCFGANEAGQSAPHVEADEVAPTRVDQHVASIRYLGEGGAALGDSYTCVIHGGATICWGSARILGEGAEDRPVVMPWRDAWRLLGGALHGCASFGDEVVREHRCFGLWDGRDPGSPGDAARVVEGALWASAGFRSVELRRGAEGPWFIEWGGIPAPGAFGTGMEFPPPRELPILPGLSAIALGALHGCGQTLEGSVACWGDGRRGALGTGAIVDDADAPPGDPVTTPDGVSLGRFCAGGRVDVVLGEAGAEVLGTTGGHTCALTWQGELWCWGANEHGQLGDRTTEDRAAPRRIDLPDPVEMLACGGAHTCAITRDQRLWCWGDNTYGQLGVPSTELAWSATPVQVDVAAAFAPR